MRTWIISICLLALVPGLALALGDDVLVYYGNSGNNIGFSQLVTFLDGLAPTVTLTDVWPGNLAAYRLVFTSLAGHTNPSDLFTPAQVGDLNGLLASGGRLVVIGDYSPFTNNTVSNRLFVALGVNMSFDGTLNGPGCNANFASAITPDPITAGVASLEYAASSGVVLGAGAISLVRTAVGGPTIVAVAQPAGLPLRPCFDVVAQGDVNILSDGCAAMSNVDTQNYVRNLYTCAQVTPVEPATWGSIKAFYE